MDSSKVPLPRRTRLQKNLFYIEFNERKKKAAESGADRGSGGGNGGNRERVFGCRARFEGSGGSLNLGFGGSVGGKEGFGSGSFQKRETLGTKKVQNLKKGMKKNKNVVPIDDDSKKIRKNKKGMRKDKNVVKANVDSKKNQKSSERLKKNKNRMGIDDDDDDDDDEEEEESEDEVQFLGMKDKGCRVVELDEGAEDGVEVRKCNGYRRTDGVEVVSSSREREKSAGFRLDDEKSCGESNQVRSGLEEEVIDVVSTDSEESSESHDVSESNGNDIRKAGIVEGDRKEARVEGELKRGRGRPCKVANLGQLSSYDLDDEGKDGNGSVDGDRKERSVEGGLKRRFCGLDILVDCKKEDGEEENEGPKTVAERVRLRHVSISTKSEKKKQKRGTFSDPFTLKDEEHDSSSGDEDDTDGDAKTSFKNWNDGKYVWKSVEKGVEEEGKGKVGRPAKRRCNVVDSAAPISVDKILADSIWEKGDVTLENLVSSGDHVPDQEATLPLKFRFEDEDPKPPEKSCWEIEADKLFAEMDFVLAACEIGSSDSFMVDNEDSITEETGSDPAICCRQGKHQLVLDEQIGLKCKFCSFVKLEIKHILPSFSKHPWGRANRRHLGSTDHVNVDKLQFQDSSSVYQSGSRRYVHDRGTVWDIIPGVKDSMYPHQREGFEFIWKNIAGGIDLEGLEKHAFDGGSGCIISHAPGTGKSRLTIVFLQTYMELYQTCRPVIIAPSSMLLTWEEEFRKWKVDIPFHNLNKLKFSGRENAVAVSLVRQHGSQGGQNENSIRLAKLYSWKMYRSILGISYTLFEQLVGDGVFRKMLLELPGLLVLDEGHTPRNEQSRIWQALSGVETQKRIILSGTPFQNNFRELFNTFCLVRPKFTDRIISETHGHCGRKRGRKSSAARGKWDSLTSSIGRDAYEKVDKLRATMDPFVHVHKGSILKESLPGLKDSMVVLQPTHIEKALIKVIQGRKNQFELYHLVSLISVNPSQLLGRLSKEEELSIPADKLERLRFHPEAGVKTKFLMELIRLSEVLKEKVLVFSQYTVPLTFLRDHLKSHFDWTEGKELLYMDGKCDAKQRQSSINLLNDPASEVQVLLASMKACCEGINLVGASRVVLLDVVWNPSVERQAISRAYRLGQKKIVYVYHLITSGTMEGEKYLRQAEKDRLSELVFSSVDGGVHRPEISCTVTEDKILQEMVQHEKLSHMFEKILNQPKEYDLIDTFG